MTFENNLDNFRVPLPYEIFSSTTHMPQNVLYRRLGPRLTQESLARDGILQNRQ